MIDDIEQMTEEEAKIEMDSLDRELVRRMEQEKYLFYEPSGKGEEFIDAVAGLDNFITLFSAANGVGKTATAINILAHTFWNTGENEYFLGNLFTAWPPDWPKKVRIISDPTNLEKNIIPAMEEWFPHGRYQRWKGNKKFYSIWKTDTDWEIDIMTYEQAPREFEGPTFGFIWCDEPPPEAIYKANISRLRKGGIMMLTGTPLAGSAYLYDAFATGNVEVDITLPNGEVTKYMRKVAYVEADVESACKIHGVRGHLEHSAIEAMIAEYDEDEKQARIYGKFQHLVGMVFKKFDRKIHVIPPFPINKRDFCVVEYIDPHPRNPDAVLWVAIDRYNQKYVIDELFTSPDDVDELVGSITGHNANYRVLWRKGDPSMFNVNQHDQDGKSLGDRMSDRGLTYEPASKRRADADRRIAEALAFLEIKGNIVKPPELYIFSTCQRLIFELEHYRWDEHTGKSADKHGKKEKPIDKDDHMIENLGRALLDDPQYRPLERYVNNTQSTGVTRNSDDPYK